MEGENSDNFFSSLDQYLLRRHDPVVAAVQWEGWEDGPAGHGDVPDVERRDDQLKQVI